MVFVKVKPSRDYPSRIALSIIRKIIATKGPIENKQLWALSQKVQPTPEEIAEDKLGEERTSEISQFTTPLWVPPPKPPVKEKALPTMSKGAKKLHRKMQEGLVKSKKLDNGHPIKSMNYLKDFILPSLVNLQEIEKFHMKRKLNEEEIAVKLQSMTPEARLRKGPNLITTEVSTWLWRLKEPKKPKTGTINNSKVLEEVLGKNEDWSHLNKRRQAKRVEKIEKDINWAKRLLDVKMQGVVEKARELEKMQALHAIEAKAEKALALEAPKLGELPTPSSSNDSG